ncbi:hypothetical protein NEOC95_002137 [Neochlamydia sp. AcF95]|nr:hypothetical protein [Neochlamydia sp. AcF95]
MASNYYSIKERLSKALSFTPRLSSLVSIYNLFNGENLFFR